MKRNNGRKNWLPPPPFSLCLPPDCTVTGENFKSGSCTLSHSTEQNSAGLGSLARKITGVTSLEVCLPSSITQKFGWEQKVSDYCFVCSEICFLKYTPLSKVGVSRTVSKAHSLLTVRDYFHSIWSLMTLVTSPPSSAGVIPRLDYKKVIACLGLIITRLQGVGESLPSVSNNCVSCADYSWSPLVNTVSWRNAFLSSSSFYLLWWKKSPPRYVLL